MKFNFYNKKSLSLVSNLIVIAAISLVVLFFTATGVGDATFNNFEVLQVNGDEQQCRAMGYKNYDKDVYCRDPEENIDEDLEYLYCNEQEREEEVKLYEEVKEYTENEEECNELEDEECTCVMNAFFYQQDETERLLNSGEEDNDPGLDVVIGDRDTGQEEGFISEEFIGPIRNFITGNYEVDENNLNFEEIGVENLGFNSNSVSLMENFAQENNIEEERLIAFTRAIASIETNNDGFDSSGNPRTRFECHLFNRESSSSVPCTTQDGESFSRVLEETNYNAFQNARNINSRLASSSSSFGLFQILGNNYEMLNLNSPEDVADLSSTQEGQVELFLDFIKSKNDGTIVNELQKENEMNYRTIAENYNGAGYRNNNYHTKLRLAYEEYYEEYNNQLGSDDLLAIINRNNLQLADELRPAERSNPSFTRINYENQGATRNYGLSEELESILQLTAQETGVDIFIYSGGQPATGNQRVGSRRHDFGNAADLYITQGGNMVCNGDPKFDEFVRVAFKNGIQAGGSSHAYMGNCNMHLDIVGTRTGGGIYWKSTQNFIDALQAGINSRTTS